MSTATKRWWRVAVMTAVAGGAAGVARYASATEEPAVWGAAQIPATPAAATFPVPPLPQLPADPRGPLAPPALPGTAAPTAPPPAPKPIDISPVAPPTPLVPPPVTAVKPPSPLPAPSPVAPPPTEVAQPAPPAKSAEPVKPTRRVTPDFNLQPPPGGNSVKTDAPAPPTLPAMPPVTPPTGLIPPPTAPRGDVPAKIVDRPKPAEMPLLDSEKFTFPLPTATPTPTPPTTHPGDPIVTNYFKQAATAAVIGGALAGAPLTPANAFPAGLQGKTDPTHAELKRSIDALQTTVNRLVDHVEGKKDEGGFKLATDPGLVAEVKKLKDEIAALKTQLTTLQSSSLRPPSATTPDPMAGKGTVSVVNQYPVEISIVVNEKSYRVAPNAKQDITVTAGDFSYQLLQNGAQPVKSTIKEKEVVTLRIK